MVKKLTATFRNNYGRLTTGRLEYVSLPGNSLSVKMKEASSLDSWQLGEWSSGGRGGRFNVTHDEIAG